MKVRIPGPLHSYTGRRGEVEAEGRTVAEVLLDLDRQFPGIRFRMIDEQDQIRPHMRVFVNQVAMADFEALVGPGDEVQIIQALSGG